MSWMFATPPGTAAAIVSISACVSSINGSCAGVIAVAPGSIAFAGTRTSRCVLTAAATSASVGVREQRAHLQRDPSAPQLRDQPHRQQRVPS